MGIYDLIRLYRERFGDLNLTLINVNLDNPAIKQRLMSALESAIESGVPVTDEQMGFGVPEGAQS